MDIKPSNKTAAIAGMWSAIGLVPLNGWVYTAGTATTLAWLAVFTVFLFVPFIYLVLGKNRHKFSRTWIGDPAERAEYFLIVKRILSWLGAAALTAAIVLGVMKLAA
ncbi:MAG: hypothetical protein V4723_15665 [Pseudomonadota bacterium]